MDHKERKKARIIGQ